MFASGVERLACHMGAARAFFITPIHRLADGLQNKIRTQHRCVLICYIVSNAGCLCSSTACMDQGPVHVTVTGMSLPRKSSSDSTKMILLVGVRPRQRPLTLSSNKTSTVSPRYFLLISATI